MLRQMLKSKLHRLTVTASNLNYVGSITLDPVLVRLADMEEFEQVAVVSVTTGARFETYVILGEADSGDCCLNGAAARLAAPGDIIIVLTYGAYDENELRNSYEPRIVHVNGRNRQITEGVARRGTAEAVHAWS